ncbi:GntR family transcriptional regulator [Sphingobium ummariense]
MLDDKPDQSIRERLVRAIIRGLYQRRFEPGERLHEPKLTSEFGVSRGPVREALNQLAAMGIVTLEPQRGAQMRRLTPQEAIDILVIVQSLVGTGARLAATRIHQPGAREALLEAMENLVSFDQTSNAPDYAMARDAFYAAITRIAGNAELSRVLMGVQIHLIRVQFRAIMRNVDRRRHRDYHDIVEAILSGKPAAAEKAAAAHIARSIRALEAYQAEVRQASTDEPNSDTPDFGN